MNSFLWGNSHTNVLNSRCIHLENLNKWELKSNEKMNYLFFKRNSNLKVKFKDEERSYFTNSFPLSCAIVLKSINEEKDKKMGARINNSKNHRLFSVNYKNKLIGVNEVVQEVLQAVEKKEKFKTVIEKNVEILSDFRAFYSLVKELSNRKKSTFCLYALQTMENFIYAINDKNDFYSLRNISEEEEIIQNSSTSFSLTSLSFSPSPSPFPSPSPSSSFSSPSPPPTTPHSSLKQFSRLSKKSENGHSSKLLHNISKNNNFNQKFNSNYHSQAPSSTSPQIFTNETSNKLSHHHHYLPQYHHNYFSIHGQRDAEESRKNEKMSWKRKKYHYACVVNALCKERKFNVAFKLLFYMHKYHPKPDFCTYNMMIRALCLNGKVEDAEKLILFWNKNNKGKKTFSHISKVLHHSKQSSSPSSSSLTPSPSPSPSPSSPSLFSSSSPSSSTSSTSSNPLIYPSVNAFHLSFNDNMNEKFIPYSNISKKNGIDFDKSALGRDESKPENENLERRSKVDKRNSNNYCLIKNENKRGWRRYSGEWIEKEERMTTERQEGVEGIKGMEILEGMIGTERKRSKSSMHDIHFQERRKKFLRKEEKEERGMEGVLVKKMKKKGVGGVEREKRRGEALTKKDIEAGGEEGENFMVLTDKLTFSNLIDGYLKKNEFTSAIHLLESAERKGILPTITMYNKTLEACVKMGNSEKSLQILSRIENKQNVLSKIENKSFLPQEYTYFLVLSALGKSGKKDGLIMAKNILNKMKKTKHCKPTARTYNVFLHFCSKMKNANLALEVYEEMKKETEEEGEMKREIKTEEMQKEEKKRKKIDIFDACTYNTLINCLSDCEQHDRALSIYNDLLHSPSLIDCITVSEILKIFFKKGKTTQGLSYFFAMKKKSQREKRTEKSENEASGCNGKMDLLTCDVGLEYDLAVYKWGVKLCIFEKSYDHAIGLCGEIMDKGFKLDEESYNLMIHVNAKCGKTENAFHLFDMMAEEGMEPNIPILPIPSPLLPIPSLLLPIPSPLLPIPSPFLPSPSFPFPSLPFLPFVHSCSFQSAAVCNLLDTCATSRKFQKGVDFFHRIKEFQRVQYSVQHFNLLIKLCGKCKQSMQAIHFFRRMRALGLKPNAATFSVYLPALESSKLSHEAVHAYEYMKSNSLLTGPYLNFWMSTIVSTCTRGFDLVGALRVYKECKSLDVTFHAKDYMRLLETCDANGAWKEAIWLLSEYMDALNKKEGECNDSSSNTYQSSIAHVKHASSSAYDYVISACDGAGEAMEAWKVYREMKERGVVPTYKTHALVVQALRNGGLWKLAMQVYDEIPLFKRSE